MNLEGPLREYARSILKESRVKGIVGYEKGSRPFFASPTFLYSPDLAENLIWNPFCVHNLSKYSLGEEMPVAIVVKACDASSLVSLLQENQIRREDIHIIGLPCRGCIDLSLLEKDSRFLPEDIEEISEVEGQFVAKTRKGEFTLEPELVLLKKCLSCKSPIPSLFDHLLGDETIRAEERISPDYSDVKEMERVPTDERLRLWERYFARCIRCNACRNICPVCFCKECVLDLSVPQWVGRALSVSENMAYQVIRAYHVAGRCTGCGECERACPMGIPLRRIARKLEKEVFEHFGYLPGRDPQSHPPLITYRQEDPEVASIFG